ncbi:MAG TPA: mechanosensitive ion channel domain-containing protein [Thermoanaerobaculia bacterium]|nr:mechanosensitive ion channel domain-containing protein [Thermoanaerobaculia bacterium]
MLASLLPALAASFGALLVGFLLVAVLSRRFLLVRQFALPLNVAILAGALKVYQLFEAAPKKSVLAELLFWCLLFVPIALALRLATLYLFEVHLKVRRGVALPTLLPAVAVWTGYLLAALVTLPLAFEKVDFKGILATSAVTSLVLGLALQPILTNFFAGLVVSLERSFGINDWIRVGDQEGRVVAITWRTTHLRTRDNDHVILPNAKIADERVLNFALPHRLHMERIVVGAHYRTPPYRVRRALLDAAKGLDGVLETPTPEVFLLSFGESAIEYELRVWIEDYSSAPRVGSEIRGRIWEAFKRAGITIPFPMRTIEVAGRPGRRSAGLSSAHLYVVEGPDRGASVALAEGGIVVGRSRSCTLTLSDTQASKEHLAVEEQADGSFLLRDLGSSFGTRVNGEPVTQARLADLDRIQVGDSVIVFEHDAN